ncbi:MAG: hypothetical protein AUF65_01580 [Chloroflexi bacterium 13_1_20CM_50_12]|nr:MAG: hypothetical protein AUF65_01580 [Chloroflexi bacterium 13_1_20CM_50_12]
MNIEIDKEDGQPFSETAQAFMERTFDSYDVAYERLGSLAYSVTGSVEAISEIEEELANFPLRILEQ